MHKKNVEIYHSGWLVKSPPNHRGSIFKARWRRRWFTLKQGELPGQFFLEYFTDNSCRKRKGVIDLDQVEQVDAGLSLDKANIKFPWMFDMRLPNRTYYLAADNEQDMRDWVMVICQVCNLQETEEKSSANDSTVTSAIQYYNLCTNNDFEAKEITSNETSSRSDTTALLRRSSETESINRNITIYENDDFMAQNKNNNQDDGLNYSNLLTNEEKTPINSIKRSTGAIKKIPENLKLLSDDKINNNGLDECTNRVSGPYIPLSDCFSGSPVLFKNESDPKTPLNSLDPKFYDNPRSHHLTNIGLNLTDDQPNSPKKTNLQQQNVLMMSKIGNNSSPTDSDGSTDEEWNEPNKLSSRKTLPSDSSMENEVILASAIKSSQCYMRMSATNPIPLPPKRISLVLDRKIELSDTEENVSPIIGPREKTSDDSYDFPRSHNTQRMFSGSHRDIGKLSSSTSFQGHLMTSTPNLIHSGASTLDKHFYGNAAPRERNVFVFDPESIAMPPPPPEVNRTLKPRKNGSDLNKHIQNAPQIDRKLKPTTSKCTVMNGTDSIKRRGPETISLCELDDSLLNESLASIHSIGLSPKTPDRLQYLDLDHTSSPQKSLMGSIASTSVASMRQDMASLDISFNGSIKEGPGVAYTTVDFLKTDAFNRVREDSEMTRASKSRIKN